MIAWTNTLMADRERIDDKHIKTLSKYQNCIRYSYAGTTKDDFRIGASKTTWKTVQSSKV